jgi:hypothetical protein
MLNNREMRALGIYCNRYRVKKQIGIPPGDNNESYSEKIRG